MGPSSTIGPFVLRSSRDELTLLYPVVEVDRSRVRGGVWPGAEEFVI